MIIIGYLLLVLSYLIPVEKMEKSLKESTYFFKTEGTYYAPASSKLDNWTDSNMLMLASFPVRENVWRSALKSTSLTISGKSSPVDVFIDHFDNNTEASGWDYSRYWHGYLIFLKPLLCFFNYGELRNILSLAQLLLLFLLFTQSGNKRFMMFPIVGAYIFLNPIALMSSMQFSSIWIITLVFLLFVFRYSDKWNRKNWELCFLIFGCLTSYFDFLTYPIVALALPLITLLILQEKKTISQNIVLIIDYSMTWFFGYAAFWAGKWFLSTAILHRNIILDALNQIIFRTGYVVESGQSYTYFSVLKQNFRYLSQPAIYGLILILIIQIIYCCGYYMRQRNVVSNTNSVKQNRNFSFLIVSLYPFLWYAVTLNHSSIHSFFTWRNFVIIYFVFAAFIQNKVNKFRTHNFA